MSKDARVTLTISITIIHPYFLLNSQSDIMRFYFLFRIRTPDIDATYLLQGDFRD